jgi:hypothetical protein
MILALAVRVVLGAAPASAGTRFGVLADCPGGCLHYHRREGNAYFVFRAERAL